ncbi:MAG: hypothetical protein RL591_2466 [Planctomycetota bacterium]|jgi:hypothetical protein
MEPCAFAGRVENAASPRVNIDIDNDIDILDDILNDILNKDARWRDGSKVCSWLVRAFNRLLHMLINESLYIDAHFRSAPTFDR